MVVGSQLVTGTDVELVGRADGKERWRVQLRAHRAALAQAMAWAPLVELVGPPDLLADVRRQAELSADVYRTDEPITPAGR